MNDSQTTLLVQEPRDNEAVTLLPPPRRERATKRHGFAAHAQRRPEVLANDGHRGATLTTSAAPLLNIFARIRVTRRQTDPGGLHRYLRAELISFENHTRAIGLNRETRLAARFLLCTALDEAVLNTPWGCESAWGKYSLLSLFHKQTSGGELCFEILGRLLHTPQANLELLELFYRCLSLGFEGCYRVTPDGRHALASLRRKLFRLLEHHRDHPVAFESFLRDETCEALPGKPQGRSLRSKAVVCVAILSLSFAGFSMWINALSEPLLIQIAEYQREAQVPVLPSPADSAKQ